MSSILIKAVRKSFLSTDFYFFDNISNRFISLNKLKHKLLSTKKNVSNEQNKNSNGKETVRSQVDINKMKNSIREKYNVTFDTVPTKSENDKKEYLVMKLDNGLKVLLISDVENLLSPLELTQDSESPQESATIRNQELVPAQKPPSSQKLEPSHKSGSNQLNEEITKTECRNQESEPTQELETDSTQQNTEESESAQELESETAQEIKSDQQNAVISNSKTNICSIYGEHPLNKTSESNIKSSYQTKTNTKQIIPNKTEKLAACSLSVGVGSFSDPEGIPGLAHFLEHMIFMGSKKYPKENDFDLYITTRGGSSNAFTNNEITTFYFTCPEKHLCNVMDRFANFFISPLLMRESMSREREAVDSEFQQNLSSDSARTEQILCSTAPIKNPAHKFSWGNLVSLKTNVTDDVLYKTLREFWKNNYSANRMTVAVQGRLPLDILGKWVAQYFGQIPSNNMPPIVFPVVNPPFKMNLFNKIYTVMPVEDRNHLQLTWAFPPVKSLYKSKPLSYLCYLIDHKGEGSLFSYLHEQLWIIDLRATGSDSNSMFSLFSIDLILTEKGLEHFETIIELVFNYIELLKHEGPSEPIFRESQIIEDLEFRFQYENEASNNVLRLSHNMQIYPPIDYITGNQLLFEYKADEITKIVELMTPDNVNIMILSKSLVNRVALDQTEPWFKTKYKSETIPEKYLNKWNNCQLNPKLVLPKPNIYIPWYFNIIPLPKELPEYPKNIINNECIEVWYKQDGKFKLPYSYITIYLISPIATSSPQNSVMCDIFQWLFSFLFVKEAYPASLAGLHFSISSGYSGLILGIDGFSHKIPLLLKSVFKEMISFAKSKKIPQGLFDVLKEQLGKEYHNNILDPSQLASELFLSILCTNFWGSTSDLEAIHDVTIEKCQEFNANFFENLYIKCLIQGNISEEQAMDMAYMIKQIISYKPLLPGTYPQTRIHVLPKGENIIRVKSFNTLDTNCNVTNYYQCGLCNIRDHCIVQLLMLMMEEPLFNTLRTQEQLAYSASCQFKDTLGILGFTMTVLSQANKFNVEHVENRMTLFLNKFKTDLENMRLEDFNRIKDSLKILLLVDDTNLMDEVQRNWSEIVSEYYMFDRVKREIKAIETINLPDMKLAMKVILHIKPKKSSKKCLRKLSIQVDGERNQNVQKVTDTSQTNDSQSDLICSLQIKTPNSKNDQSKFIKDIDDFKSKLFIYPYKKRIKK